MTAVVFGLVGAFKSPRLADSTQTAKTFATCVKDKGTAGKQSAIRSSPTSKTSPGHRHHKTTAKKSGHRSGATKKATGTHKGTSGKGRGKSHQTQTICPAGYDVKLGTQLRGGFDPSARLTALIAVVAPLITTIVAFFWGAKAGRGQASEQLIQANAAATTAQSESAVVRSYVRGKQPELYEQMVQDNIISDPER
jgi:hypothetical protein